MRLKSVFIRFYKSFNYHYIRKIDKDIVEKRIKPKSWEYIGTQFYPHIEIPVDPLITTIVGANESGKSHLLSAIEKGITGQSDGDPIQNKDFCRYSHFFNSTDPDAPRYPDFGFEWVSLTGDEKEKVRELCKASETEINPDINRFFFFRTKDKTIIYLPTLTGKEYKPYTVEEPDGLFPNVFRVDSQIALPERVPLRDLITGRKKIQSDWRPYDRQMASQFAGASDDIRSLLEQVSNASFNPTQDQITLPKAVRQTASEIEHRLEPQQTKLRDDERLREIKAFNLAHDLIYKIADVRCEDLTLLSESLATGETGLVMSLVDKINSALARKLRFPRVWSQDKNFALRVDATEHELNFIINDRTDRQYSFDERSSGLKHFLSYYIQYLTHEPSEDSSSEILLMDEPDAFLSGEAQQDLLKIFQMFADPKLAVKGKIAKPTQVIYVTHSPFLIDKNHAERVRALEKPEGTKGTHVIPAGSQNRYEPLRSVFGAFVGETTFISQCNLMVEGPADQILLAGAATYLRQLQDVPESEMLDLNRITIVSAGGTPHIPYLVYLARGRDSEKPAVIVLLDSDREGNEARTNLQGQGEHPEKKAVINDKFVIQLGDIKRKDVGLRVTVETAEESPFNVLEDLVPPPLALRAVKEFLAIVFNLPPDAYASITPQRLNSERLNGESAFTTLKRLVQVIEPSSTIDIDKVPFARTVVDLLPVLANERSARGSDEDTGLEEFEHNMRAVFRHLRRKQSEAEEEVKEKRMRRKVHGKVDTFLSDYGDNHAATRDDVSRLLSEIESDLEGDDKERAFIIQEIITMREDHQLKEDPTEAIKDYERLLAQLERLKNARDIVINRPRPDIPVRNRHLKGAAPHKVNNESNIEVSQNSVEEQNSLSELSE